MQGLNGLHWSDGPGVFVVQWPHLGHGQWEASCNVHRPWLQLLLTWSLSIRGARHQGVFPHEPRRQNGATLTFSSWTLMIRRPSPKGQQGIAIQAVCKYIQGNTRHLLVIPNYTECQKAQLIVAIAYFQNPFTPKSFDCSPSHRK